MMTKQAKQSVPEAVKSFFEAVVEITDEFCAEHLTSEYAELARQLTAALSRKRPSPLIKGKANVWACAVIYTLGRVNFLFDKTQTPHLPAARLCELFGVSSSTASAKSTQIEKGLRIYPLDPLWFLPSKLDKNPMAWIIVVNGIPVDVRDAPLYVQEEAFRRGLIPYVPTKVEE